MDRAKKLGEGSIGRLLAEFSLPAVVGMVAQALYIVVDRAFVGKAMHKEAIAAITVATPFMFVIMAFSMLIGFGAAALISIRLGQQRRHDAEHVLGNAVVLLVLAAAAITAIGLLSLDPVLRLSGASPQVLPLARDYLRIIIAGSVFQIVGFGLNAVIRGEGNPRISMVTMLLGVSLNALLAWLFLFRFGWGMRGAGLAVVLAQAASAAWVVGHFFSRRSLLHLRPGMLRLVPSICATIIAIGSPPCVMQLAASVLQSLLNQQLHHYGGDLAISVMGIIYAVVMMVFMPIFGINQGVQPIIGYNYGAERFDRVKRALQLAVLVATAVALAGFALTMLAPGLVVRLFTREDQPDPGLLALGTHAMRLCTTMMPLVGFQVVSASYFQAVGKPVHALLLSLSRQVLILIPAVLVLPYFFGLDGVWAALPTADLTSSVLTAAFLWAELRHLHRRHTDATGRIPQIPAWPAPTE